MSDDDKLPPPTRPREKTDEELRQLCIDMYAGRIFSNFHCDSPRDVGMVFMPIGLGGLDAETEPAMIYEYLDKAGPRSINGMPGFFSCNILNRADFEAWRPMYQEYEKLQNQFKEGES